MGIVDDKGRNTEVEVAKMKEVANAMRAWTLVAIHAAGSGPGQRGACDDPAGHESGLFQKLSPIPGLRFHDHSGSGRIP